MEINQIKSIQDAQLTFQKIQMLSLHHVDLSKADEFIACLTSLKVLEIEHSNLQSYGIISLSQEAKRNLIRLIVN
jgi:hypothetical protein